MSGLEQFSLQDKVVVITGGTGVLGGAFAHAVAGAGARVVILGRNSQKANERVERIRQKGGEAMAVIADVLEEDQVEKARDQICQTWGKIDGLVNAAGGNVPESVVAPEQDLFSVKLTDIRKAVDLNLYGTVNPTHILGRVMAEQGKGTIVNISSLAAQRPLTRVLGYSLAKAAIESYTQWMAIEMARRYGDGLRVNAIAPGVFLTAQNQRLMLHEDGSYSDRARQFVDHTPFGRLGVPEELTGTMIWMLSDASRFLTGEVVVVDGGFNAYSGV